MAKKLTLDLFVFVMIITSMLILFPLQKSYETSMGNIREYVHVPKIGFLTVGDDFQVTLTITNNYTKTKYFNIEEYWRPYQITGSFTGEKYEDDYYQLSTGSTLVVNHTFTAAFPDLWTLQVRVTGFDNSTRMGLVDPSYPNDTNYYVHPSSDQDIRILSQSTNESALVAEKSLNEVRQQEKYVIYTTDATIGLAIATSALAGFVLWQTLVTKQQIKLSHLPYLTPRYVYDSRNVVLLIVNIGNGNAVDVHLKIHDEKGVKLGDDINRFALISGEIVHTGIDLDKYKKVKITGTYLDLNDKKHKIDEDYEYPPKKLE